MAIPGGAQFEVAVRYDYGSQQAVATPRGELDIRSAADFARALDAATEGRDKLVVDLADLDFCDGAGLKVMASTARRLAERGGGLALRSPSAMMTKLLDITGLGAVIAVADGPGPTPRPVAIDTDQMADAIADSLLRLTGDALVDAAMRMVATLAARLGVATHAASVTLRRRGQPVTVAATDPVARHLDQVQYDSGGGPCVEAVTYGHAIHAHLGTDDHEWPELGVAARDAGIRAVLSTPLLVGPQPVGALNLYAGGEDLSDADSELASVLVGEAVTVLGVEPLDRQEIAERLAQGLAKRDQIAHAQGIMMERHNLSAPRAYDRLLRDSAAAGTLLNDNAAALIEETRPDSPNGADRP